MEQVIPHTKPLSNSLVKAMIRLLNSSVFEAKTNLITALASFGGAWASGGLLLQVLMQCHAEADSAVNLISTAVSGLMKPVPPRANAGCIAHEFLHACALIPDCSRQNVLPVRVQPQFCYIDNSAEQRAGGAGA